jgi:hypothetical protein
MKEGYYFHMTALGPIASPFGGGLYKGRLDAGKVLPKHLFAVVEVPDVF